FDNAGRLRNYINVFVNDRHVRDVRTAACPLGPGDSITIVASIAGGCASVSLGAFPFGPALLPYASVGGSRHLFGHSTTPLKPQGLIFDDITQTIGGTPLVRQN